MRGIAADPVVLRADAADADRVDKGIFTVAGDTRSKGYKVLNIVEIDVLDEVPGKSRDRERYVLNRLVTLGRGHDDFIDYLCVSCGAGHGRNQNGRN